MNETTTTEKTTDAVQVEWIEAQKENVGRLIQPPAEDQLASWPNKIRAF